MICVHSPVVISQAHEQHVQCLDYCTYLTEFCMKRNLFSQEYGPAWVIWNQLPLFPWTQSMIQRVKISHLMGTCFWHALQDIKWDYTSLLLTLKPTCPPPCGMLVAPLRPECSICQSSSVNKCNYSPTTSYFLARAFHGEMRSSRGLSCPGTNLTVRCDEGNFPSIQTIK